MTEDTTYYDENTLIKVRKALRHHSKNTDELNCMINDMQNQGILFRERKDDGMRPRLET